jgi:hypothetical protein
MARYELGAVYKIDTDSEIVYYVRLLEHDCYAIFEPFEAELCEEKKKKTPYRLYITCNTFPVKRGVWEKVLPSPDKKDTVRWKSPDLANYANFNTIWSVENPQIFHKGNTYICEKEDFISLVKSGMIKLIFNRHENIPSFLERYYEGWANSYILDKNFILMGTVEHQKETLETLKEMGFDTTGFTIKEN